MSEVQQTMSSAFISDKKKGRFFRFNTESMTIEKEWMSGAGSYPADFVSNGLIYVSTRGLESIQPIEIDNDDMPAPICLHYNGTVHKPRSTTSNRNRETGTGFAKDVKPEFAAISGADKVYLTIIDASTGSIVRRFGSGDKGERRDFGGGTACGHPAWVSDGVLLLDRINRLIELYHPDQKGDKPLATVKVPTSAHHIEKLGERIFAFCEGNITEKINPQIIEIAVECNSMTIVKTCTLPTVGNNDTGFGAHHLTIDTENNYIYAGVSNGRLYHVDLDDLSVQQIIKTGKGCGHVTICKEVELAVTTNHTDSFMSVFSLVNGNLVRNITITDPIDSLEKKQGHTSFWNATTELFYTTAASSGRFLEIDLVKGGIKREIKVPDAVLIQGAAPGSMM